MEKFVALDIGNVCVKVSLDTCEDKLIKTEKISKKLFYRLYQEYELGKINTKIFLSKLSETTGYSFDEAKDIFCTIICEEIKGINEILTDLINKGFKIAFLSDTSPLHLKYTTEEKLSFSHLISGGVYSYETGCFKPETAIFKEFEKKYGIPALYIDDKRSNCEGAERLGWSMHCIKNVKELKSITDLT